MNFINIILIIIILLVVYGFIKNKNKPTKPENMSVIPLVYQPSSMDKKEELINDIISLNDNMSLNSLSDVVEKETLNPNFLDIKFNNDYRYVMNAMNNLIYDKKQLFNIPNRPIKYSEPDPSEVKYMVEDFVTSLNKNVKTDIPNVRSCNSGWDEALPEPNMESGWTKMRKSLGLPVSLFKKPAPKAIVKLIAILKVQKYETEDQVKYLTEIVIQKENIEDQMILSIGFVQDTTPLRDERLFFAVKEKIYLQITIENISIVGYLSKKGNDAKLLFDKEMTKYDDINNMEHNNLTDPKEVYHILMDKYKHDAEEMEQRNALLDEEGQDFHKTLPSVYNFSNIISSKTLFPKKPY